MDPEFAAGPSRDLGHGSENGDRRTHRPAYVVASGPRSPEHGHDAIADMLVDRPADLLDDRVDRAEEDIEERLRLLGTERVSEGREPHQVDEQNGDLPALM